MAEPRILIVYHSVEGQTARIAERIAEVLRGDGLSVDVRSTDTAPGPEGYDGVVLGDPVHAVHHSRPFVRYLRDHAPALDAVPTALFQVSLTSANPDEPHTVDAQKIVAELLDRTGLDADIVGMFAGRLAYTQYGWMKRHLMRSIVKREGGDLDMTRDHEYTDWAAVEEFAHHVGALVREASITPPG